MRSFPLFIIKPGKMKRVSICTFLLLVVAAKSVLAQSPASHYTVKRTENILLALMIDDAAKKSNVQVILQSCLDTQETVFKERTAAMDTANKLAAQNKELAEARSEKAWDAANGKFNKVHATFLGKLSS